MTIAKSCARLVPLGLASILMGTPALAQRVNPLAYDDPAYEWLDNRDPDSPRPSPNAIVGLQLGSTRVFIAYGRPRLNGRQLDHSGAYGRVWRTGANEATTITFTDDVLVEGQAVAAGTYTLFTVPGEKEWTVILNSQHNQWGTWSYSKDADVVRFNAAKQQAPEQEWLSFDFEQIEPEDYAARVVLRWGETKLSFRVQEP